jgi:hypothetical protein
MTSSDDELDKRLLGILLPNPKRTLVLAMATGMAVTYELGRERPRYKDVLHALHSNPVVCDAACECILRYWVERMRAGDVTEEHFQKLVADVVQIARAS